MKVVAEERKAIGSGASRRLRRAAKVPGIVYGGESQPMQIALDHNPLYHSLRVEAFHSSILDMELGDKTERVLLRDVQWHPYKPQVLHNLWMSGAQWCDWVSFDDRFPVPLQLVVVRVPRVDFEVMTYERTVRAFLDEVEREYQEALQLGAMTAA